MDIENDDIVIEDDSDSQTSLDAQKRLREKVKQAEAKAKEYLDGWQRSQADFVNLRKRDEEVKKEFIKFVSEKLMGELIPVLDSLELAGAHGEAIYKQLMQILKQNGLEELDPKGEIFDPRKHESIGAVIVEHENEDHKILEVIQKGYILHGKIIRPAKVRIGEYKE